MGHLFNYFQKDDYLIKMKLILFILFLTISSGATYCQETKVNNVLDVKKITDLAEAKIKLANKNYKYKATVWNTNFTIPAVRFNLSESTSKAKGTVSFFNSIGAGFGQSKGEIREIRDEKGEIIDQDFTNTFAWYFGFLFAADTGDEKANVFAPMFSIMILDLQVGIGYELGTLQDGNRRTFFTLGYNISVNKLKRGGYYVTRNSEIINDTEYGAGRLGR